MKLGLFTAIILLSSLVAGCVSSGGTRIDNVPMYGQPDVERPAFLKQADQDFIEKASKGIGSREEASKVWWVQAERFMQEGNLDYAMRRYNQSWLLNPNNYQPYWGFARVSLEKGRVNEAISFLEKAESLIDDQYQKVALLADLGTAYTYKGKESPEYFEKANGKFSESIQLEETYPNSWRRWAFSLYEQKAYPSAWEKVIRAQKLGAKPFPSSFLSALEEASPRPE